MAELTEVPFRLWARMGPKHHALHRSIDPHLKEQFWRMGTPTVNYRHFLPSAVQKRLNRSICPLGCGLEWAKGCTNSITFARWHQQPKRHPYRFSRLCTDDVECPYTLQWDAHSPPKICPFPCGNLDPHLIHCCLGHPSPQPKWHLDRCRHFSRAH